MSSWVLVAAVLQGGVWTLPPEFKTPFVHFETQISCAALRDARNWIERNTFTVYECVAVGERHSHLPAMAPAVSNPTRIPHPAPGPAPGSSQEAGQNAGLDEASSSSALPSDDPIGTLAPLDDAPLGDAPLGDAPALLVPLPDATGAQDPALAPALEEAPVLQVN